MYDIDAMPGFLFLGNEGEGGAGPDVVTIDVSAWVKRWPSGVFAVTYTRPGQHPYASRADHVHPLPSLSALGALPRTGSGAPSASAAYIGQLYVDTVGKIGHIAVSVGAGANDWKRITNA